MAAPGAGPKSELPAEPLRNLKKVAASQKRAKSLRQIQRSARPFIQPISCQAAPAPAVIGGRPEGGVFGAAGGL